MNCTSKVGQKTFGVQFITPQSLSLCETDNIPIDFFASVSSPQVELNIIYIIAIIYPYNDPPTQ